LVARRVRRRGRPGRAGLIAIGVEPGDKVGLWMTNRAEWLFLLYAVPAVGAVLVPLNTRYRADDMLYAVDQSDTTTLLFNDRSGPVDYSAMVRARCSTSGRSCAGWSCSATIGPTGRSGPRRAGRRRARRPSPGVTLLHGFDAHWGDFLRAQRARPRRLVVRVGTLPAGQESSTPVARRAQEEICPTVSGWGMSEVWTACVVNHITHSAERRTEGSGRPMADVEVRVVDPDTGEDRPPGEPGELLCRSYTTTLGYYEKPAETAEAIVEDGWMHSGDLARLRPDGDIVFMGRLKDMLKVGGENVAPAEMEGRLRELDGVVDVAVVGHPDPRLGEVPVAYVMRKPGASLDPASLLDHLRAGSRAPRCPATSASSTSCP
jgi:acyl-CoA synthetase (AMP-forming)/AMP-acid ligase II